jgi:hypothetical protein
MAGFQLSINGRFWLSTEGGKVVSGTPSLPPLALIPMVSTVCSRLPDWRLVIEELTHACSRMGITRAFADLLARLSLKIDERTTIAADTRGQDGRPTEGRREQAMRRNRSTCQMRCVAASTNDRTSAAT